MDLSNWINQARASWMEFQPLRYKAFQQAGILERELRIAAERTYSEVSSLEASGVSPQDAWEMVRQEYLFPPPEAQTTQEPVATPGLADYGKMMAGGSLAAHRFLTSE